MYISYCIVKKAGGSTNSPSDILKIFRYDLFYLTNYLVKEKSRYFITKIWVLLHIFLYKSLSLKEINIVQKWPRHSSRLKPQRKRVPNKRIWWMDSYRNLKSRRGLCIANILKYLDKNVQKLFKKVPNGSKLLVLGQTCSKIVQKSTYRSFYFILRHVFMISENMFFLN